MDTDEHGKTGSIVSKGLLNHNSNELTEQIIKAFYKVYNVLGYGYLEKVYIKALIIELEKLGLVFQVECPIQVFYDAKIIGEYFADIIVENRVIIEVKAVKCINLDHEAQLLNYLKATRIEIGLLLNFGEKPEVKRKIFDNVRKQHSASAYRPEFNERIDL